MKKTQIILLKDAISTPQNRSICKRLLKRCNIPQGKWLIYYKRNTIIGVRIQKRSCAYFPYKYKELFLERLYDYIYNTNFTHHAKPASKLIYKEISEYNPDRLLSVEDLSTLDNLQAQVRHYSKDLYQYRHRAKALLKKSTKDKWLALVKSTEELISNINQEIERIQNGEPVEKT